MLRWDYADALRSGEATGQRGNSGPEKLATLQGPDTMDAPILQPRLKEEAADLMRLTESILGFEHIQIEQADTTIRVVTRPSDRPLWRA